MNRPEEYDASDEQAELDLTEDEFDARFAAGEAVLVVGGFVRAQLRDRAEDYYTLHMSDSSALASAGRWGEGRGPNADQDSPLVSHA